MRAVGRRGLLTGTAGALLAGALGACAGRAEDPNGPLTFWSSIRGTPDAVAAWNAAHPGEPVALDMVTSGLAGGNAKLSNAVRAGNAPDVVSLAQADLPAFALDGVCADLTDRVSPALRAALPEVAWHNATLAGRVYGVPLDLGPMLFLHREDLLRAHRLDVPTTWPEFAEAARVLRRAGLRLASFHPNAFNTLAGHVMQAGGRWFGVDGDSWVLDFLSPGSRRVAEYWQGLIEEDLLLLTPGNSQEWLAALAAGRVAGHVVGSWYLAGLAVSVPGTKGRWRAAPLPQWDPGNPVVGNDGVTVHVVTADSPRKERALRFVEWLSTAPEAMAARLGSGRSSLLPAAPALRGLAYSKFRTDFYGGQDLYRLVSEQADLQRPGWLWGPRMQATATSLHESLARLPRGTTITASLAEAEAATLPDLVSLGLTVRRA